MGIAKRSGLVRAFMMGAPVALLSACGGTTEPPPPPPTGSVAVSVTTTGSTLDPDGYTVSVDGGAVQPLAINGSVTFGSLSAGQHDIQLSGVEANCTVGGSNPVSASVTAGTTANASFAVTCVDLVGDLEVIVATTGTDLDPDGYTLIRNGGAGQAVAINDTIVFAGIAVGDHTVRLADVAPNCMVLMPGRIITVTEGTTASTTFDVTCSPLTGSIDVTATTTGVELDPDGYSVTVDGTPISAVGLNATVNVGGVPVGNHDVGLSNIASNCSVTGANPQIDVAVTDGGTTPVAFDVTCVASAGSITVTTQTTGSSIDPNGYGVSIDGGAITPIGSNAVEILGGLSAGSHDVELFGNEPNCTVNSTNPQMVAVTDGGDTPITFDVSCSVIPPLSGKIVFYTERAGGTEIFMMNTDGTSQTNLSNRSGLDQDPEVSPDGSKIVFWTNRDGDREIYVMSADGSGKTRLTNNPQNDRMPTWSPDGSKIAFVRFTSSSSDIWLMNADGTGQTNLTKTSTSFDGHPSWSPDGTLIAFSSDRSGDQEVWTIDVATGFILTNLTNNPGASFRDGRPSWSPDGAKIAFDRNNNLGGLGDPTWLGDSEIMVMDADGQNVVQITNDVSGFVDFQPAWSPDGSRLVFASDRDGDQELYTADPVAGGGSQVRLTFVPGKDEAADYSP